MLSPQNANEKFKFDGEDENDTSAIVGKDESVVDILPSKGQK